MRKKQLLLFLLVIAVLPASAVRPELEELGHPFKTKALDVQWQLQTNQFPAVLNAYQVRAAKWSPEFLSNIVTIVGFTNPAKVLEQLAPALSGHDVTVTDDAPRRDQKSIVVNPSRGRIYFVYDAAKALPNEPVEGVPTEEQVLEGALNILSVLGMSKNELRLKPNSNELFVLRDVTTHTRRDKTATNIIKRVIARGVFLFRQVEQIAIAGRGMCGGIHINYGNQGKIAEMELVWRNVHSPRKYRTADRFQLTEWIRQGKATIETEEDPSAITRLTITNATVFYFGKNGSDFQKEMFPFANLGAIAELRGRRIAVSVNSPVIRD